MTQISRRRLDEKVYSRVYEIFLDALGKVRSREEVSDFIRDFLTPTEQVMLPKRLTIAYLLTRGFEQRKIAQYLKVSNTTINRVSTAMKIGGRGYVKVIESLLQDKAMGEFLGNLDDALEKLVGGIPVGLGSGNWSNWKRARYQAKKATAKPF